MTIETTRLQLDEGLFVDVDADGRAVVLTTEAGGRTTARIRLTLAAFERLQQVQVCGGATRVDETQKRLRS